MSKKVMLKGWYPVDKDKPVMVLSWETGKDVKKSMMPKDLLIIDEKCNYYIAKEYEPISPQMKYYYRKKAMKYLYGIIKQ